MTAPAGRVGFVGLGAMGLPMALNLRQAGFEVVAWNRSQPALETAAQAGCEIADTARQVADRCITVLTMLPDLPQVRDSLGGSNGLLAGSAMRHLVVMGTVSPEGVRVLGAELAARGIRLVDAPVSGGTKGASAATLAISAGGDPTAFAAVRPYFEAMGSLVLHMGPIGAGSLAKACNQLVVAATVAGLVEAVHLAERGGLDVSDLLDIFGAGLAKSEVLAQKRIHFVTSDFVGGGPVGYLLKDLRIVLESGSAHSAALPVAGLLTQLCQAAVAQGGGPLDSSSLLLLLRQITDDPTAGAR